MADLDSVKIAIKYDGLDADKHRLDAYSASLSLEGITWALNVTLYCLVAGKRKHKGDLSKAVKIYITSSKKGSFTTELIAELSAASISADFIKGYLIGGSTALVNKFVIYIFKRALGISYQIPNGIKKLIDNINKKDPDLIDDLVQQIEPSLSKAHDFVGKTAKTAEVKINRTVSFELNQTTKEYVEAEPVGKFDTMDTNITAYNVNSQNGRLYHPVDNETVSMTVKKEADPKSKNAITASLNAYQEGNEGKIRITAERVATKSGRLKKYLISHAERIPQADWVNGVDPLTAKRP